MENDLTRFSYKVKDLSQPMNESHDIQMRYSWWNERSPSLSLMLIYFWSHSFLNFKRNLTKGLLKSLSKTFNAVV